MMVDENSALNNIIDPQMEDVGEDEFVRNKIEFIDRYKKSARYRVARRGP